MNEELDAVNSLKDWERNTLKEVDPKFEVDDDSDEENKNKAEEGDEKEEADPKKPGGKK